MRLGSVLKDFRDVFRPTWGVLGGVESRLRGPKAGPGLVLSGSSGVSAYPNRPISKFFEIAISFQDFLETKIKIIFQDFGTES